MVPPLAKERREDWQELAKVYHLHQVELVQLIACTPVLLQHQWQMDAAAASIRQHHLEREHEQLVNVLCILVRAELRPELCASTLSLATLMVALQFEEAGTTGMAVAVRLARVLACKLERVYQFSKAFCTLREQCYL